MAISNQRGNVLLYVVSGIVMVASLGLGMFYMTSTSSLSQAGGSGMNRAYYLALAGKDYAIANWNNRSQITSHEFTVSTTERFSLLITDFQITSTGIVNQGTPFEARKTIKAPPPSLAKKAFFESFEDLSKWATGTQVGGHAIATVSGDKALDVTSTQTGVFGSRPWSFIQLNTGSSGANVDFTSAWKNAGYCLSHDLQVKITNGQSYHMEGLTFKIAGSGSGAEFYGVSYTRRREVCNGSSWDNDDNISASLKPDAIFDPLTCNWWRYGDIRFSNPAIIFWKRQGGSFTWLAYKLMTYDVGDPNYVFNSSNLLINWSNLQVRVIEAYPLGFMTGGPTPLLHGSVVVGGASGASARITGTPIMTSETWSSTTAAGTLTLTNISGTFQTGENLLVGGTTRAVVSGTLGAKTNYIRVYYGDVTSPGTTNNIPTDNIRGSNPRIVSGSSNVIHWPVDNVSDWSVAYDYMTLVQWDGRQGSATRLGGVGTQEAYAIIRDGSLLTPDSGTINYSGIALHATGDTATSTYFDDFAIQY